MYIYYRSSAIPKTYYTVDGGGTVLSMGDGELPVLGISDRAMMSLFDALLVVMVSCTERPAALIAFLEAAQESYFVEF